LGGGVGGATALFWLRCGCVTVGGGVVRSLWCCWGGRGWWQFGGCRCCVRVGWPEVVLLIRLWCCWWGFGSWWPWWFGGSGGGFCRGEGGEVLWFSLDLSWLWWLCLVVLERVRRVDTPCWR
jgi:hypothetical protein